MKSGYRTQSPTQCLQKITIPDQVQWIKFLPYLEQLWGTYFTHCHLMAYSEGKGYGVYYFQPEGEEVGVPSGTPLWGDEKDFLNVNKPVLNAPCRRQLDEAVLLVGQSQ